MTTHDPPTPADLVTLAPAARIANVSEETLRRWGRTGRVRVFIGAGGRRLFDAAQLREMAPREVVTTGKAS